MSAIYEKNKAQQKIIEKLSFVFKKHSVNLQGLFINHSVFFWSWFTAWCKFCDTLLWYCTFDQFWNVFTGVAERRNAIVDVQAIHELADSISKDRTSIFLLCIGNVSSCMK